MRPAGQAETLALVAAETGARLDKWLAAQLPGRSRSEIQRWIAAGLVVSGGAALKASHRVAAGEQIDIAVPLPADYEVAAEPIPLVVIYEDADLLVIDKPAGMVVHPAAGNWQGTLVNAVLHHCPGLEGVGGAHRPGIVHRLDKDTSGLILVAKNDRAHRNLQEQFKARAVEKSYLALVYGAMAEEQGVIDAPIGRDPRRRDRMAVAPAGASRPAVTFWQAEAHLRRLTSGDRYTLLVCRPLTGRTHQIRVHLAHIGHPIVGDGAYGGRRKRGLACPRQFLHAGRIRFTLPSTGEPVAFSSPLPPDLAAVLDQLQPLA